TLRTPQGASVARLSATDDPAMLGPVDAVVVAVKAQDLDALDLGALIGPDTVLLPLLNGVEATARLDAAYGAGRSLIGVARISATITAPGEVTVHGPFARFELGEADGAVSPRTAALRDLFSAAGIETSVPDDPLRALWVKFLMLCPLSGVTAAARCDNAAISSQPLLLALYRRLSEEVLAVGRAQGVALSDADLQGALALREKLPDAMRASMAHDLAAGKRLEVDWLAGAVSRLGDGLGVDTPANDAVWAVLSPFALGAR
ncbi:MAG: 2-dehydropantoate 2-reductase, partial [Alphaproteobacteria bacterium HGW-Alphaproteobacteria-8]